MKKNLRKIPKEILEKIKKSKAETFVAGCAVKFSGEDIRKGTLSHLGIVMGTDVLLVPDRIVPPATQGKNSAINVNGEEIRRDDLPKETHYTPVEAPNWGDSYNGTHTVWLPHEAYPREFNSPRLLEISMTCANPQPDQKEYLISFRVEEILDIKHKNFHKWLLEDLNLLQENVGAYGIEEAEKPIAEYINSLNVTWDILPPGTKEEAIRRIFSGAVPKQRETAGERYDFFMSLKPIRFVFGKSGFRRYFGAKIEENLIIFENMEYGNAIYILFDKWEEMSKRSRLELLSGKFGTDFFRVVHKDGWEETVRSYISEKKKSA